MKVKVLSRNPDRYFRETKNDLHKLPRNYDPALHPFEMQREYVRAVNAVKLERVFAKPFLGSFDGHGDVVSCLHKHPDQLTWIYSGAADGIVKQWNMPLRKCVRTLQAHEGYVRGMTFTPDSDTLITVGDDKNIRFWDSKPSEDSQQSDNPPKHSIITKYQLTSVSHHAQKNLFSTCGDACLLWEDTRNEPISKFDWGAVTMNCVRFNPSQVNILGGCASDRGIILYDIRGGSPIRKVVMGLRTNTIAWNPMEPFVFAAANEDYNSYIFDMRRLKSPMNVLKDHVMAVIDLDFSPTGREIVTGSYDKTIRVFPVDKGHSREVYHTKRMQRVTSVAWTLDNKYILSGSDEMNIRIWKAKAWEKLGTLRTREKNALNYAEGLKEKYAAFPQVRRISRHRHVPKHVYRAKKELEVIRDSKKRKEDNRRSHTRAGTVPHVPERQKNVVAEQE